MPETATTTPRERYRAQVRAEVKEHAWEQIATAGASALSLNAIAKQMGLSGPALYRYFAGRDELITDLIRDAYRSLADSFRAAVSSGADVAALGHTLREWALADPHRYFLIYGTPIPGYHAPDDITAIVNEILATLLEACVASSSDASSSDASPSDQPESALGAHLQWAEDHAAPPTALLLALRFWTRLHGALSLELAGHFTGLGLDPAVLFAAELDDLLGSSVSPAAGS